MSAAPIPGSTSASTPSTCVPTSTSPLTSLSSSIKRFEFKEVSKEQRDTDGNASSCTAGRTTRGTSIGDDFPFSPVGDRAESRIPAEPPASPLGGAGALRSPPSRSPDLEEYEFSIEITSERVYHYVAQSYRHHNPKNRIWCYEKALQELGIDPLTPFKPPTDDQIKKKYLPKPNKTLAAQIYTLMAETCTTSRLPLGPKGSGRDYNFVLSAQYTAESKKWDASPDRFNRPFGHLFGKKITPF